MNVVEEQTIGQIVTEDYRTAGVFKKFGLDFCCGGKRTVAEACEKNGVDMEELKKELASLDSQTSDDHNYSSWSPDFLIDYIVNTHHNFVRTKLPEIETYANKVAKVHGSRNEELNEIRYEFMMLKDELLNHLEKEEQLLFPYIKAMVSCEREGDAIGEKPHFDSVENPVKMMEEEHDEAGGSMAKIQRLSNNFTPPEDACATYRVLFQNLEGFQDDLHKHVHLENNILFPKALEMEQSFRNS